VYDMKNVILSKEMLKNIAKNEYYSQEDFIKDCKCYIKALKSGRLQYIVTHVSNSGMSRNIFIQSYEGTMAKGHFGGKAELHGLLFPLLQLVHCLRSGNRERCVLYSEFQIDEPCMLPLHPLSLPQRILYRRESGGL
jgi:hypothetical protein